MKENMEVFYAIKNFIKKDFCSERVHLVSDFLQVNNTFQKCYNFFQRSSSLWLMIYAACSSRPTSLFSFDHDICLWKNPNELNCFNKNKYFDKSVRKRYITFSILSLIDIFINSFVLIFNFRKLLVITKLIHRKDIPYFVKLRTSQLLFDYLGFKKILSYSSQKLKVSLSTDGQPFAYALFALCQKNYCHVDYIAHAYFVNNPGRIHVDNFLSVNKSLYESFVKEKSKIRNFIQLESNIKKMKEIERYSFLIALSKSFRRDYLIELLEKLDALNLDLKVIIRYHPTSMFSKVSIAKKFNNLIFLQSLDQDEDLKRANITIGGASNILIDSMIAGNYTFFDSYLDSTTDQNITLFQRFPRLDLNNIEMSLRRNVERIMLYDDLKIFVRDFFP